MNIDVTAINPNYSGPGAGTWSEKFADVLEVNVNDETQPGALEVWVDHDKSTTVREFRGDTYITVEKKPQLEAVFAPGSWHSWRRID